jgi:capsular exopolysaccharide synthesis family protein
MPDGYSPRNPPEVGEAERHYDLRESLGFIWRQWKFVLVIMVVVCNAGVIFLLQKIPLYTATSEVLLDRQRQKAPGGEGGPNDAIVDIAALESQMSIIRSTVLLRRVVEKEHLASPPPADPVAEGASPAPPSAPVTPGADAIPPYELSAIEALKKSLKVSRQPQGFVLAISVTSPNPARAAQLANAVSDAYVVDKLDTRFDAAKRASSWLSDRLLDLRTQVRESEEAVAQFRAEHSLVQGPANVTLTQQQLSDLNTKLIDAKADLSQKKARVNLLGSLQAKNGNLQNMQDLGNSGVLPTLRQQLATLSAQEADLRARYGTDHPLVVNIRAQIRDVEQSIGSETQRLAAAIRNEYELAQARATSLEQSLKAATGQSNVDDATTIRLRELERTATVNKTLFEDFLKQAKITQEQSTFEPQEVRLITPATVPGEPSYPPSERFMLVSLFIGGALGIAGALAKEKLNTGFSTPKQVEDFLGLPVLTSVSRMTGRDLTVARIVVPIQEFPIAKPLSRYGEAIRALRSGIHMTDVDHPPKVIQITSAIPGEGKSTIAQSLAASAALAKLKILLIDADLRHPSASRFAGLEKEKGLVDLLLGEADEEVIRFYSKGGYWVLPAGNKTQTPTDLLGSERMKRFITRFRETYDFVFIDTPPVGPVVDPVVLSHLSDKVVFVVRWDSTARVLVREAIDQLPGQRKVAGIVFNLINEKQAHKYGKQLNHANRDYKSYYS